MVCFRIQLPKPLRSPLRSSWPLRSVSQWQKGGGEGRRWHLKLFPCHYDVWYSAAIAAATAAAIAAAIKFWPLPYVSQRQRLFLFCFSFAGVKLWLNCQPGVLSWDLGHYFFGCCLVNSCGGLFR